MTEIVKVQRPISPPDAPWLIYDRDRKHVDTVDPRLIPQYIHDQMEDDHKAYFIGS